MFSIFIHHHSLSLFAVLLSFPSALIMHFKHQLRIIQNMLSPSGLLVCQAPCFQLCAVSCLKCIFVQQNVMPFKNFTITFLQSIAENLKAFVVVRSHIFDHKLRAGFFKKGPNFWNKITHQNILRAKEKRVILGVEFWKLSTVNYC